MCDLEDDEIANRAKAAREMWACILQGVSNGSITVEDPVDAAQQLIIAGYKLNGFVFGKTLQESAQQSQQGAEFDTPAPSFVLHSSE